MVKTIYAIGVLSLTGACIIFSKCAIQCIQGAPEAENIESSKIVERFKQSDNYNQNISKQTMSPLVKQAEFFALYLNPPEPPKPRQVRKPPKPVREGKPVIIVKPEAPKPKFRVIATSYYRSKPNESMAFISEPDSDDRWVKRGEQLGHFIVDKIQPGILIYKYENQVFEIAVNTEKQEQISKPDKTMLASERTTRPRLPRIQQTEVKKRKPLFRLGLGRPETRPAVYKDDRTGS